MGGKGGALSVWLKEFLSLVFTQTLQAFIYAIIISFIMYGMTDLSADVSTDDQNASIGLMAVFALASVFKVEDLAKKVFGMQDTKASHGNAMKSLAKTAFAINIGKRALDNVGKIGSGIAATSKSFSDKKKQRKRLEEDMADEGFTRNKDGKLVRVNKSSSSIAANGGASGGSASGGTTGSNRSASTGNTEDASSSTGASSDGMKASDYRRVKNALRNYEDKRSEINKSRNDGIKDIVKGTAGLLAAPVGAIWGATIGGADGNIDEMFQGFAAGAGVADAVAEGAVEAVTKVNNFVKTTGKGVGSISGSRLKKTINEYSSALEQVKNINYSSSGDVEDAQ